MSSQKLKKVLTLRLILIAVIFWFSVSLIYDFNWERGTYRAIVQALVLLTTPVLMWLLHQPNQPVPRRASIILAVICIGLLCRHFARFAHTFPTPALIDVPLTTLSAAETLLHGKNPYTLPINPVGLAPELIKYSGFKYLPMMAAIYLPLGVLLGQRGILLTNLLLDLVTVALVFRLSSRISGQNAGWFATLLYLMLPLVPIEIFSKGVTDLAATVPLLMALLSSEKPGLSGFWVGFSISTKLFPGILFIPCCLSVTHRGWYAAGIGVGLLPTLVFLFLSPQALVYNTVLFSFSRSTDSTSWLYFMPPLVRSLSAAIFVFALIILILSVWYKRPTLGDRCGFGVVCLLGAILNSPSNHRNYQLWWIPLFVVLLGTAVFRYPTGIAPKLKPENEF